MFVNQYAANHDVNHWEAPDEFRPSRFLTACGGSIDKKASSKYLIFSTGSRKCPGDNLAWTFSTHLLATLLSVCTFEGATGEPPSLEAHYGLTMTPQPHDVRMTLHNEERFERLKESSRRRADEARDGAVDHVGGDASDGACGGVRDDVHADLCDDVVRNGDVLLRC